MVIHHTGGDFLVVGVDGLDVDADGPVIQHTCRSLMAVAQAEVDVWPVGEHGLAVGAINQDGRLVDAVFSLQGVVQQSIGCHTQPLVALVTVSQGLLTSLGAHLGQGLLQVKVHDLVVDVDHFFSSNLMWRLQDLMDSKRMLIFALFSETIKT